MSKAGQGQTLIDVALERSGKASEAWGLAVSLGLGLTDFVEGCETGSGPDVKNRRVANRYAAGRIRPATELREGIGVWAIGVFKVSQ